MITRVLFFFLVLSCVKEFTAPLIYPGKKKNYKNKKQLKNEKTKIQKTT